MMGFELRDNSPITPSKLLSDLKRVHKSLGTETITQAQYDIFGKYSHKNFYKHFGSWNKALVEAGISLNRRYDISDEELFDNLESLWKKLNRQPYYSEVKKPDSIFSVEVYTRKYGGWSKACETFIKNRGQSVRKFKASRKTGGKNRNINDRLRLKVYKRDNYSCVICGANPSNTPGTLLHIDHIKPFSLGGSNDESNLRTLCAKHNLARGNIETL